MVKRTNIVGGLVVEGRTDGNHAWDHMDDMDECATIVAHRHRLEIRVAFAPGSVQLFLPVGHAPLSRHAYLFLSLKRSMNDTKMAMRIDDVSGPESISRDARPQQVAPGTGWIEWDFSNDLDGWCRFAWAARTIVGPADEVRVRGSVAGIQTPLIRTAGRYAGPASLV
jgi:hypothetical protein